MGKFERFAGGKVGSSKVERAKFENLVKAEIEKQVTALTVRFREAYNGQLRTSCDAVRRTYEQFQWDCATIALNELGWGESRINRFMEKWDEVYNTYLDAMTDLPEADYKREKLDAQLQMIQRSESVKPFIERYEFLPEIKYEVKLDSDGENRID